jgi:hypothetical protein
MIRTIHLSHETVWSAVRGEPIGFLDGGMASVEDLGTEPLAVRVGSYIVRPGIEGAQREEFGFEQQVVTELFADEESDDVLYAEYADNTSRLRDAARMTVERAAAVKLSRRRKDLAYLFLHGPLVDPVAPYWGPLGVPPFRQGALAGMEVELSELKSLVGTRAEGQLCHLIAVQRYLVHQLFLAGFPVVGVIERASPSRAVTEQFLVTLETTGSLEPVEAQAMRKTIRDFRISDALLFGALLEEGQYLSPVAVNKNDVAKSPDVWKSVIGAIERPFTSYVKPTEEALPFRVETTLSTGDPRNEQLFSLVIHMSRLLPRYAFPVGLDIVDKHAKIPAWMSRQIRKELVAGLLRRAIESGDQRQIQLVRRRLLMTPRDMWFRPGTDL